MPTLNLDRAPLGGATGSGAGGRAVLPRTLERFADQPWLRTAATGHHPEPAQRFRSTRFYNQQTFHGTAFEKFTEAKARVSETEQPDAAARIIAEGARAPSPHYRGIPPVEFSSVIEAHAGHQWSGLKYHPESFAVNHVRGPVLQPLSVDPGPQYTVTHPSTSSGGGGGGEGMEGGVAPNLLSISRGYASAASASASATGTPGGGFFSQSGVNQGSETSFVGGSLGSSLRVWPPGSVTQGYPTGPGGHPAGVQKGGLLTAAAPSSQALSGAGIRAGGWDPHTTVASQFRGGGGAGGGTGSSSSSASMERDVVAVGPSNSVAVPHPSQGEQGYASLVHSLTAPLSATTAAAPPTFPATQVGWGVGAPGAPIPRVATTIHPLDAIPGGRRGVDGEATGRRDAEAFRRRVAGAQRRQDYLTLHAYPHGVLGLDGPDNLDSAVYGEVAALRLAEANARSERASQREVAILKHSNSIARRGYDLLATSVAGAGGGGGEGRVGGAGLQQQQQHQQGGSAPYLGLTGSARVGSEGVKALGEQSRFGGVDGGVKFLERKGGAVPPYGVGVDTRRTVGVVMGEEAKQPAIPPIRPARVNAIVWGRTQGRDLNPITHLPLPPSVSPTKR